MKYKIVSEYYTSSLEKKVNELCKEGWRPQGGIAIDPNSYGKKYYQAMVKEDEDDITRKSNIPKVIQV